MIKRALSVICAGLVVGLLASPSVHAQAYTLSNTTLNGAVSLTATTFVLTSASALSGSSFGAPSAGQCYFVDAEFGVIVSISSTTITVQRPFAGRAPHATAAVIFTGPCSAFKESDPPIPFSGGNADCTVQPSPWINIKNANMWRCNTVNSTWAGTNFAKFTYNSVPLAQ